MHHIVTKFFHISDPDFNPDSGENYVILFYNYMIQTGVFSAPVVAVENFLPKLRQVRQQFINDNKLLNHLAEFTDERSLTWIGIFTDEAAYDEYRATLLTEFGTDFHIEFESDKASLTLA
jgi:hypothetical protein